MTINQIECFVEAARLGNISKAAEILFITQQAVSNQIKTLERDLGYTVLIRGSKGVSLTKEGEILFSYWKTILDNYRISIKQAQDFHSRRSRQILIGLEDMGKFSEDIMQALPEFGSLYKDLQIQSQTLPPKQMLSQFETGDLDLAILYESEFQSCRFLKSLPLHKHQMKVYLYFSHNHPLAQKSSLTLDDIKDETIGVLNKQYSLDFEKKMQAFFDYNHVAPPTNLLEYSSRRDLEIGLLGGQCIAIVYEEMFFNRNHQLISQEIDVGNNSSRMAIFWKSDTMYAKAHSLCEILTKYLHRYLS